MVTSVTSSPIVWSPAGRAVSAASGIDGSTGGTSAPLGLVGLATAVLLHEPDVDLDVGRGAIVPRRDRHRPTRVPRVRDFDSTSRHIRQREWAHSTARVGTFDSASRAAAAAGTAH